MVNVLFQWMLSLINTFSKFGNFLVTPFLGQWTPLTLFSIGGLTLLITILVGHLLNYFGG